MQNQCRYSCLYEFLFIWKTRYFLGDKADEWEAELEGELNEYEVVKEENPEWENQIQEMLDAEENSTK
jgi:hypothetical protein